jgi:hypothetical protein
VEHAQGFSSLALLGGSSPPKRVLYLLAWSGAVLTSSVNEDLHGRSTRLAVDGWNRLPFQRDSIDMVVVDLDVVPRGRSKRRAVAGELGRILRAGASCVAVITHRRRPRDRRAWSHYRLVPPIAAWRALLREAGLEQIDQASLDFDGARITGIALPAGSGGNPARARTSDAVALVLSSGPPSDGPIVEELRQTISRQLGAEAVLDRVHVRKIGKVAAFVAAGGSRVVVKLPRSPIALVRARRNYAALQALHGSPAGVAPRLVPAPLGTGIIACQPYFLETVLRGSPRDARVTKSGWEPQAIQFVTALHVATAHPVLLTEEWFDGSIEAALAVIERHISSADRVPIGWLRTTLRRGFLDRALPLVRSHGDFTGSNCLYEADGTLSGVVDWELSRADALPLLDMLQCVDLPSEYTGDGRWLRAELVFDAVEHRGPLSVSPEIGTYMNALGLEKDLLVPLFLMHWVDHVAARVVVRRDDDRWFRGRVSAPLLRLRQLAQAEAREPRAPVQQETSRTRS